MTALAYNLPQALDLRLPWEEDQQQEEAFKRWLKRVLIPLLLLFFIVPWLPTFDTFKERESTIIKTEIVLEQLEEPEPEPTPPPKKKPKPKQEPKPEPLAKKPEKPKKVDPVKQQKKKEVAKEQGLTEISSQLSSLRQSLDMTKLQQKNVSKSTGGKVARADSTVLAEDALTQKSEGIVVDDNLLKDKKVALAAHQSTKMDGFVDDGDATSNAANFYSDLRGQRSIESIRRIMEAGKSKAYMYYLRELKNKPELEGTFIFELVIQPDGSVTGLKVVSSELGAPDLEKKILSVVQALDFGAEDVSARSLKYKFTFLPN